MPKKYGANIRNFLKTYYQPIVVRVNQEEDMQPIIKTKEEAESWFLRNHSGAVLAINEKGEEKECDNYPDTIKHLQSYAPTK